MDLLTGHCRLRVRYDECDSMGITYHARYLDWFVIGRTELLRGAGLPYAGLERAGLLLPVLEARCRYLASTRYDDTVCIETTLLNVTRTRMSFAYRVFLERPADEAGVGGPAGDVGVSGSADESGFDAAAGEVGVDGPADECGVNAAADKVRAAGPRGDGARAAQPGRLPRLVAEGETMHAFVDERHRPVDVKKRFPDVWAKLAPLAEALRAAGAEGCRLSTKH